MRGKTLEILLQAQKSGRTVGAFNIVNLETAQAVVRAAEKTGRPCILQVTMKTADYLGDEILKEMVAKVIEVESTKVAVGFHLDHGKNLEDVQRAIGWGVDSVMIDASTETFEKNLEITGQVVAYAHQRGVAVQAELGSVPYQGREKQEINWEEYMTNPVEAEKLIQDTGADALAVGIGNAHGFFRERETPDWERLMTIREKLPLLPLILHGASDWETERVMQAVEKGINCFNVDTALRKAFNESLREILAAKEGLIDPREILGLSRESVQKEAERKMKMFAGE